MKNNYKSITGILAVVITLTAMTFVYLYATNQYINYNPNFPIYRGEDTNSLLKNELQEYGKNSAKTQRSMDASLLMLIISTCGIFATIIFNPKLTRIAGDLQKMDATNQEQHLTIHNELKILKTVNNIEIDLREILTHQLDRSPLGISRFINFEGENIIRFCHEVVNSKFDHTIVQNIDAKINSYSADAKKACESLPHAFCEAFKIIQKENTELAQKGIEEILYDKVYNSKHNRFRMLMMHVLNKHLSEIIEAYKTKNR